MANTGLISPRAFTFFRRSRSLCRFNYTTQQFVSTVAGLFLISLPVLAADSRSNLPAVDERDLISDFEGTVTIKDVKVTAVVAQQYGRNRQQVYFSFENNSGSSFSLVLPSTFSLPDTDDRMKFWYGYDSLNEERALPKNSCQFDAKSLTIVVQSKILCRVSVPGRPFKYEYWDNPSFRPPNTLDLALREFTIPLSPVTLGERIRREREKNGSLRLYELLPRSELND